MIDPFLLLAPVYLLGVMALLGFVGCFTKPPRPEAAKRFITDETVGTLRSDTAWFGMTIIVGPENLQVRALGRYLVEGNSGTHRVRIVDAASLADVAVSMVNMSGASVDPDDPYVYGSLATPFPTLNAGSEYHVLSEESISGDQFYDQDTIVRPVAQTIPDGVVKSAVYSDAPGVFVPVGQAEHAYGPVNFQYIIDVND